jgi:hypothetical protein
MHEYMHNRGGPAGGPGRGLNIKVPNNQSPKLNTQKGQNRLKKQHTLQFNPRSTMPGHDHQNLRSRCRNHRSRSTEYAAAMPTLPKVDECFIALGTTIKVAGSQAAFRAIDLDAVVAVAKAAQSAGATKIGVVSAMGANVKSSVFYNRTKGEMELALSNMGIQSLVIARPSLLDGDRKALGQPVRSGEGFGLALTRGLRSLIPMNYRAVSAKDVATALIQAVQTATPGVVTLLSGEMQGRR